MAAGERFERPYPDSKSRVLPPDDPASHFQRNCFHAPHTQHRRFIDVVAELLAVCSRTIHQFAVISSALAIQFRCKLDLKAFVFNRLCTHNFGSSEENRTPISALKSRILAVRRRLLLCAFAKYAVKTKSPRFLSEAQKNYALWIAPVT